MSITIRRNVYSTMPQGIIENRHHPFSSTSYHYQDYPLTERLEIWSIQAMIRNWAVFKCRPSPKQLMMACILLLEVARRCPQYRKKLTPYWYNSKNFALTLRMRTPNVRGGVVSSMLTRGDGESKMVLPHNYH